MEVENEVEEVVQIVEESGAAVVAAKKSIDVHEPEPQSRHRALSALEKDPR